VSCSCRQRRRDRDSEPTVDQDPPQDHNQEATNWTGFEGNLWVNEWLRDQRGPFLMTMAEGHSDMFRYHGHQYRQANPSWWRTNEETFTSYYDDPWVEPDDEIRAQDILDEFDILLDIQLSPGNWDFDPYLHGMANGMLLMRAIISGETPEYREAPEQWGADLYEAEERSAGFRDGVRLGRDISAIAGLEQLFTQMPVGTPDQFKLKRVSPGYYVGRVRTEVKGEETVVGVSLTHTEPVSGFRRGPWYFEVFGDPELHGHGSLAGGDWFATARQAQDELRQALTLGI